MFVFSSGRQRTNCASRPWRALSWIMFGLAVALGPSVSTADATEADVLTREAMRLCDEELYERAEQAAEKAFDLAMAERPRMTLKVAVVNRLLFNIYTFTDNPTAALEVAERNLAFVKQAAGYERFRDYVLASGNSAFAAHALNQPDFGDWCALPGAMRMLATAYSEHNNGVAAEPLAREALELSRRMFGVRSTEAAEANITLAEAYAQQSRPTLAIPALEQAASIYEDIGEYEEAADVETQMAELLRKCGEGERAEKCEYRANVVRRMGRMYRWLNSFPFGLKGFLATLVVAVVAVIWRYRRGRGK